MRVLLVCLGVIGFGVSAGLADRPTLQTVSTPKLAVPTRIAKLAPDGTVVMWVEYGIGTCERCEYTLVFDCFEPETDSQGNSVPIPAPPAGFDTCGQEDGSNNESGGTRWFFGSTYHNPYITNDMEFHASCSMHVNRLEIGWYWHVDGPGTGENCRIIVETFEDFDETCQTGDPNGQGAWLGGVLLDFGYMFGDPGHYWYTDVDLCGLDWVPLPSDGAGSYSIRLLTYDEHDPNTSYLATCAQPMLWGTGTNEWPDIDCIGRGVGACPDGGFPPDGETSHQGPVHWNDSDADGWHTAPDECDDGYSLAVCPDPLGAMLCFYADCDDDGPYPGDICGEPGVDQQDLGCLLAAWCSHDGDPNWDPDADIDGDGHVGNSDLGILLADWG